MTLFSQVTGLPVEAVGGGRLGAVRSLVVDVASGRVTHARVRRGRLRRDAVVAWTGLRATAHGLRATRPTTDAPATPDLIGTEALTERGEEHGTVLDAEFDPLTGRLDTVLTTHGTVPASHLLGLGTHALIVEDA
ncbi:PRC-barrel domain-containing protein [Streptomyces pseudogriseolus]|uniref:PRC-barrel domain-containing protein n=1 Tax=Streptomyces pseudogriseolus TaxID=36817 RepID=UPI003FA2598A